MKTKSLTTAAACASLALAALFLSSLVPINRIFFAAAAGIFTAPALIEAGWKWAFIQFAAVFLLAFFILPVKSAALLYLLLFGWYAIAKYAIEHSINNHVLEIGCKLAVFNIALTGSFFAINSILPLNDLWGNWLLLAILAMQPIFLVYDYAFSVCITIYLRRIQPLMHP